MLQLFSTQDYDLTISCAPMEVSRDPTFTSFHAFWDGPLSLKHLLSLKSFYLFNTTGGVPPTIIVWSSDWSLQKPNHIFREFQKYAELRVFNLKSEYENVFSPKRRDYLVCSSSLKARLLGKTFINKSLSFYSDTVRYLVLYNYGGCWFDLDCLCLRNMSPLKRLANNRPFVYSWEYKNYPNGAIYASDEPRSPFLKKCIEHIVSRNKGWGFQESRLDYSKDLPLLVLPCSWFDPAWIQNPYGFRIPDFFADCSYDVSYQTFFPGAFTFHWHNQWDTHIGTKSPAAQIMKELGIEL
jgi:hypothetical protein